jgi:tyrosyl-tRNA synthetase
MILQAYDFLQLHAEYGCEMQAGGSDQWGNITAGIELIRRVRGESAYGLTVPLVTKADGTKFGKTESGTIWLDARRTSPYQFYQFWMQTDDQDTVRFLKYFTFLSPDEIERLAQATAERPGERAGQRALAREVTALVHGRPAMERAEAISKALFYGQIGQLSLAEIEDGLHDVPTFSLANGQSLSLVELLTAAAISPSKRRAREDVQAGAISINDERCTDSERMMQPQDRLGGRLTVIRRGRNNYFLIRWTDEA